MEKHFHRSILFFAAAILAALTAVYTVRGLASHVKPTQHVITVTDEECWEDCQLVVTAPCCRNSLVEGNPLRRRPPHAFRQVADDCDHNHLRQTDHVSDPLIGCATAPLCVQVANDFGDRKAIFR